MEVVIYCLVSYWKNSKMYQCKLLAVFNSFMVYLMHKTVNKIFFSHTRSASDTEPYFQYQILPTNKFKWSSKSREAVSLIFQNLRAYHLSYLYVANASKYIRATDLQRDLGVEMIAEIVKNMQRHTSKKRHSD